MRRTAAPHFRKNLLALAVSATLAPTSVLALDLTEAPLA